MVPLRTAGAVLTGGASRRMGRDKVVADVGGTLLAARAVDALLGAGADPVACIGGDAARLGEAGLVVVPDRHPGDGPLGGILTALADLGGSADVVVVLAGDLPRPDPAAIVALVESLEQHPGAALAVPVVGGRRQWLHAAWRCSTARPALDAAFARGVRAIHLAADDLATADLALVELVVDDAGRARRDGPLLDPRSFDDVDTPEELARLVPPTDTTN